MRLWLFVNTCAAILIEFEYTGAEAHLRWESDFSVFPVPSLEQPCISRMPNANVPPCPVGTTQVSLFRESIFAFYGVSAETFSVGSLVFGSIPCNCSMASFRCYQRARQLCDVPSQSALFEEVYVGLVTTTEGKFNTTTFRLGLKNTIQGLFTWTYPLTIPCIPTAALGSCSQGTEVTRWTITSAERGYGTYQNATGFRQTFFQCYQELHLLCTIPGQRRRAVNKAGQGFYEADPPDTQPAATGTNSLQTQALGPPIFVNPSTDLTGLCPPLQPCRLTAQGLTLPVGSLDCQLYAAANVSGPLVVDIQTAVEKGDTICLISGNVEGTFDSFELTGTSCIDASLHYSQVGLNLIFDGTTCALATRPALW